MAKQSSSDPTHAPAKLAKAAVPEGQATPPKRARSGVKAPPAPPAFDPQILATLAIQLLQPKLAKVTKKNQQISARHYDNDFLDALKRAEKLLKQAVGLSDVDVQAYQVFDEGGAPMSYAVIGDRFKEVGWKGLESKTTITLYVEQIVAEANRRITNRMYDFDLRLSRQMGSRTSLDELRCRLVRHLTTIGSKTRLASVIGDATGCAEGAADRFLEILWRNNPGLQGGFFEESWETRKAYGSFIEYACGGLTYEQFAGVDHLSQYLSLDRFSAVQFYLEELSSASTKSTKIRPLKLKPDLAKLISLIGPETLVPTSVREHLQVCIRTLTLDADNPDMRAVRSGAGKAAQALKPFLDYLRFCEWWRSLETDPIKEKLQRDGTNRENLDNSSGVSKTGASPRLGLELIELLDKAASLANDYAGGQRTKDYVALLRKIRKSAQDLVDSKKAAGGAAAVSKLVVGLKRIAQSTDANLTPAIASKKNKWIEVVELLEKLTKYSGERKVRPYELFLFAAQERFLEEKLVMNRSKLKPEFIPYPKISPGSSILGMHGGSEDVDVGAP